MHSPKIALSIYVTSRYIKHYHVKKKSFLKGDHRMKQNCWEYKNCGREEGGKNIEQLGVCPASVDSYYEGK